VRPDLERVRGPAGEFHARTVPVTSSTLLWWFEVERPAVVLGSRQVAASVVDLEQCEAEGIEVVTRRSGGGAVLLVPDEILWVDVVVPRGGPTWTDDVSASMVDLGERWAAVLTPFVNGRLSVHRGSMVRTPWSEVVCFDGIGPGEVLLDGRKFVGISQRRTRDAARLQCAVHLAYRPERLASLLRAPHPPGMRAPVAELESGTALDDIVEALRTAFV
jgi:lipoate---protein ligase